jgi:NCS1 family nucleobase:cation symporter-1
MAESTAASPTRDPALFNDDIAPTEAGRRTWNMWHMAALWVGMAVCVPSYQLAASLIKDGMDWRQAVGTIALGNVIVLLPMILNGHAGAKYGIPFPVYARASFGVLGANLPAVMRALVACGWFGIQTWIGGKALYTLLRAVWPHLAPVDETALFPGMGPFACFVAFWAVNVYFIWKGTESIKWLETLAAPFLIVAGLALVVWAHGRAGGFGRMLSTPTKFATTGQFLVVFFPSLTAMVSYWGTLALNIPDFTRFARNQRDQAVGQALGLPTTMTLFAFIGVAVTSASEVIFGESLWDPTDVVVRAVTPAAGASVTIAGIVVVLIGMVGLSVATLSTNIAANVVSPANDISNLRPGKISFRAGGLVTAVVGLLMFPWKLIATTKGYIFTWLIGYGVLLGPIGGILIVDYFVLRRRELVVADLYRRGGVYEYRGGVNVRAIAAFVAGVAPNVPGFLVASGALAAARVPAALTQVYSYAWFVGLGVAGVVYWALMRGRAGAPVRSRSTTA